MAKLEKFREELGVISEEEFNQKVEEKVQLKSKLVGTIEKLQTAIKVRCSQPWNWQCLLKLQQR